MQKCSGEKIQRGKIAGGGPYLRWCIVGDVLSQRDIPRQWPAAGDEAGIIWSTPFGGVAALTLTSMQGACHDSYPSAPAPAPDSLSIFTAIPCPNCKRVGHSSWCHFLSLLLFSPSIVRRVCLIVPLLTPTPPRHRLAIPTTTTAIDASIPGGTTLRRRLPDIRALFQHPKTATSSRLRPTAESDEAREATRSIDTVTSPRPWPTAWLPPPCQRTRSVY